MTKKVFMVSEAIEIEQRTWEGNGGAVWEERYQGEDAIQAMQVFLAICKSSQGALMQMIEKEI